MNEIDNRAKILLAAMNANISKGDPKSDNIKGLTEVRDVISSLITTIESQDIENQNANGHIRVYKGEIEDQKIELDRYKKYEDELITKIQQQAKEIKSQKEEIAKLREIQRLLVFSQKISECDEKVKRENLVCICTQGPKNHEHCPMHLVYKNSLSSIQEGEKHG